MKALPNTIVGLIEELEELYPAKCKEADETLEDHARYAGKVELVARLRSRLSTETKRNTKELPTVLR